MSTVENVTAFRSMVQHLGGVSEADIDRAVRECLQAINMHGGKASMTLKFTFKRHKNLNDVISVKAEEPTLKLPKEERMETLMFTNAHNDLLVQRQEQGTLLLEETQQKRSGLMEAPVTIRPQLKEVN